MNLQSSESVNIIQHRPQRLLRDGMIAAAQRHPDKPAIIIEGKQYSYSELLKTSLRLAQAFRQHGLDTGDRVAIYMDNTWPCVVSIYATLLAGGVFLVINPQTKADKLKFVLDDSDAKLLLTDVHLANVFIEAVEESSKLVAIISSGDISKLNINL
jgi:long-chain acyl-CoA synthetase